MQKAESKNNLTTIYEKRLLEYLEQGNKVVNENYVENKNQAKAYGRVYAKILAIISAAVAVLYAVIISAFRYAGFSGAYVPTTHSVIGSLSIPIGIDDVITYVICVGITVIGINFLLTKTVLKKLGSSEAVSRFDKEMFGDKKNTKLRSAVMKGVGIIAVAAGFTLMSLSFVNIGFYDDYVKFNNSSIFDTYEIKNEDLKLVKVLGEYDEDDEYVEYTDTLCYLFCDDSENYYELANINPDGETAKRIDEIIEKYNITVEEVKTTAEYTDVEE